jgi:hypothetical protein
LWHIVRAAVLAVAAAALAALATALAAGSGARTVGTATAVCGTRAFAITFDPKRRVVVTDGRNMLASATFSSRAVSSRCRRVGDPRRYVNSGLDGEIRTKASFRCQATRPIRVHVNPIRNDRDEIVGSSLSVGIGTATRLRVIVSAILKNKADPYASRVYRAAAYCKPGA